MKEYNDGITQKKIAENFEVCQSTISRIITNYNINGKHEKKNNSGRTPSLNTLQKNFLFKEIRKNPFLNSTQLNKKLNEIFKTSITNKTVGNYLHSFNLKARSPTKKPYLTKRHREQRYKWAENVNR